MHIDKKAQLSTAQVSSISARKRLLSATNKDMELEWLTQYGYLHYIVNSELQYNSKKSAEFSTFIDTNLSHIMVKSKTNNYYYELY